MGPSRALRAAGPAILIVVALATLIWGLIVGGGAAPFAIGDPGPLVRWGLPIATLAVNLAAAGMVGALVTALFTLKAGEREFDAALDMASVSCGAVHRRGGDHRLLHVRQHVQPRRRARTRVRGAARPVPRRDRERPHVAAHGRRGCHDHGAGVRGAVMDADAVRRDPRDRRTGADGHPGALRRGGEPRRRRDGARAAHHRRGRLAGRAASHGRGAATHDPPRTCDGDVAVLEHRPGGVHRRGHLGNRARHDRRRRVGEPRLALRGDPAREGRRARRPRRARRVVPAAADRATGRGGGIPTLLGARRSRARLHGTGQWRSGGARPHRSADDLEPSGRAHSRGVPHRRRTAARADAGPLVHVVEPRPAVGVRGRFRDLPLPRGRLAAASAR